MGNAQLNPGRLVWSWVWIAALCLSACQPDYTRDSSKALLADSGLANRFEIERNNNRSLPIQSFLCVASDDDSARRELILEQTRLALTQYFSNVSVVRPASQAYASKAELACRGASFLIQVELQTASCRLEEGATALGADAGIEAQTERSDKQAGEQPGEVTRQAQSCRRAHVRWRIMPLASEALVDTLDIHYQRSWIGLQSGELESLLEPGLRAAARLLAGR